MSLYELQVELLFVQYCYMFASSALLWFDCTLTFTTEVQYIWRRRFTGATIVYLFTRYAAVVERVFSLLTILLWTSTEETCGRIERVNDVLTIINYFAFSLFTILRVYGVWGRDWKPLLLVIPLTLVRPVLYMAEVINLAPRQLGYPFGCVEINYRLPFETITEFSVITQVVWMAPEVILVAFTWIKTLGIIKYSWRSDIRTPLATFLLRDGTAYFLVILVPQVSQIVSFTSNAFWAVVLSYSSQIFIPMFLSRFLLDLRELCFTDSEDTEGDAPKSGSIPSSIRFTSSRIVGNLGATTRTIFDSPDTDDVWMECYEDRSPQYVENPFEVGMLLPVSTGAPTTTEVESEEAV